MCFEDYASDIDELTDTVCNYTTFSEDTVSPKKLSVKVYPDNKRQVSESLENKLGRKQRAFIIVSSFI